MKNFQIYSVLPEISGCGWWGWGEWSVVCGINMLLYDRPASVRGGGVGGGGMNGGAQQLQHNRKTVHQSVKYLTDYNGINSNSNLIFHWFFYSVYVRICIANGWDGVGWWCWCDDVHHRLLLPKNGICIRGIEV